jgi:hypothetical protein
VLSATCGCGEIVLVPQAGPRIQHGFLTATVGDSCRVAIVSDEALAASGIQAHGSIRVVPKVRVR